MSILGLLGVLFVALKLLEVTVVATWSWWLVLLPFYGGLALFAVIMLVALFFGGTGAVLSALGGRRRRRW